MSDLKKSAAKKFDDLKVVILEKTEPKLALNKHCKVCEFQNFCREEAIKKDDLSLLSLGEKEVAGLNKRGLFTITQLSHTFRPKLWPLTRIDPPLLTRIDPLKLPLNSATVVVG